MDPKAATSGSGAPSSGATLRRPVQIVKKRSGPLEGALDELNRIDSASPATPATTSPAAAAGPSAIRVASNEPESRLPAASPPSAKRRGTLKEKKRERWLLTRKTWKYMTDAGRKLIPDNAQNRKEDIPKIEAHFQNVCAMEPRFVLWRRKSSYPGAMRNSRRRLKQLLHHTGPKHPPTQEALELEEARNADQMIEMLQSYLKLDEAMKTTTLLGAKTVRPDQTMSPSAQRPDRLRSTRPSSGVDLSEVTQLLELLRKLSQSATLPNVRIAPENITADLLQDKVWLKQVYNSLKKQQLHRILSRHSNEFPAKQLRHASSLSSLFGGIPGNQEFGKDAAPGLRMPRTNVPSSRLGLSGVPSGNTSTTMTVTLTTRKPPPDTLDLPMAAGRNLKAAYLTSAATSPASTSSRESSGSTTTTSPTKGKAPTKSPRRPRAPSQAVPEKQYNTCGTQTNFIQLQEIKRVAEEYRQRQREEAAAKSPLATTPGATDDEAEKLSTTPGSGYHHRRKSSIDNEDVSQSVSDTIKRYLRMARKKSVHDDNANRFKRVNYDQNLRNIRAQGEPNPPGMDEDNNKAVQTLDAWAVITLEFIRGFENTSSLDAAHAEWRRMLDERIQKKREFDEKHGLACSPVSDDQRTAASDMYKGTKPSVSSCSSSSAPTSPTADKPSHGGQSQGGGGGGILHTSSQFLSNLWHGASNTNDLPHSPSDLHSASAMQKSKSSSNVGQFVSRKILKSRSKSQTRQSAQPLTTPLSNAKWSPSDHLSWTSDKGDVYHVEDTNLLNLSEVEANILHRVAIDKINELNIGLTLTDDRNSKAHKRRVLPKKKAITTSFFDIGKKDASGGNANLFGNSLETCVVNDKKRAFNRKAASLERGSRNSISSLFRSSISGSTNTSARDGDKLNDNVRSYESLPSGSLASNNNILSNLRFGNLTKSSSTHISRSQSDIRRKSQDLDSGYELPDDLDANTELQVPIFVNLCIKYLEENGLHMIGLFRVSTSKKRVKQMREEFDKNAASHFEADTCPHDVATLLKEFLRDLPDPLLCSHLYKAFLETQRIRNRRLQLEAIGHLVKLLPSIHRDTLYVLLKFLARVAASSDDASNEDGSLQMSGNKMDSNNLATVFAPNILRGDPSCVGSSGVSEQESMNDAINVIRIMIDHYEELFRVPADLLDTVYSHMLDACPEQLYTLCNQRKAQVREDPAAQLQTCQVLAQAGAKEATESVQPPKRLYSRKSVMHDNDASTAPNALVNGTSASKRLTHNLRSKDETKDRRQSSPNVLDKSGVVSGSLQIPMHLNQTTSLDPLENVDDVFYRNAPASPFSKSSKFEFSDIPYIEDMSVQDMEIINECFPISGSLSFSTKPTAAIGDQSAQQTVGPNVYVGNFESGPIGSRNLREPKLPTSITNIGGEIMRSKTADFEKMCTRNSPQPQPQQSQPQATHPGKPSDTRARVNPPRTKVYKRQELIQSAKHVYESKK